MTTRIEKILNLLIKENKPLTASDIALKETLEIKKVRVYLNTLYNDKRVTRVNEKKPYKYIAVTPKALLKVLYRDIMSDLMTVRDDKKDEIIEKKEIISKIKEMIE